MAPVTRASAEIPLADEIMTSPVYALRPDVLVREAALALVRRGFSGAPVVDADRTVVGVISEADLLRSLASATFGATPVETVEQVMRRDVVTAGPDADLYALASLFSRMGVRRVPIVAGGRLVGLLTRRDLMRALVRLCEEQCAEDVPGTVDAVAELELIHNPFPGHRLRKPG